MPNVSSPLGTASTAVPLVRADALKQAAGLSQIYPDSASLQTAVTSEAANVAASAGIWSVGQPLGIASEVALGVWRSWNGSNARTAVLPGGLTVTLAGDANVVISTSGAPASGTGANGDVAIDRTANVYYLKTSGAWALKGSLLALSPAVGAPSTGSVTLDGSSRVATAARTGRSYSYAYGTNSYTITASDGAVLTVTTDSSGRVTGLAGNF